jgi:hypothetical protein
MAAKLKKLVDYMRERATFEGVEWALTEGFLQVHFDRGTREFFGVKVDGHGELIRDSQQPGFFETYRQGVRN